MSKNNPFTLLKACVLLALALCIASQQIVVASLSIPVAEAAEETESLTQEISSFTVTDESPEESMLALHQSWAHLDWISHVNRKHLVISPTDQQRLDNYEVDYRVTQYLLYLVTPVEFGGAGLTHVKAERIFKHYETNGIGRFDRETLAALEEDNRLVSAHNSGQAVDISEVGQITCKIVEKRRGIPTIVGSIGGGDTTKWQQPKAVKVAWQTVDGIARHPTPRSPSLMETSNTLSAERVAQMFNDIGEVEGSVDFIRGLDMSSYIAYVGANVLLKHEGVSTVVSDPLSQDMLMVLGAAMLEKNLPDLPNEFAQADGQEDARVALAKSRLEEATNLPAGSLRGYGWESILESAGKRTLENALGLPALYFNNHSLNDVLNRDTVKKSLDRLQRSDAAFNVPTGTIEKIKAADTSGFKLAGVNVIAAAFGLTSEGKQELEKTGRGQQAEPNLDTTTFTVPKDFTAEGLRLMLSADPNQHKQAQAALKNYGIELIKGAIKKKNPSPLGGLTSEIISALTGSRELKVESLLNQVAAEKLGLSLGLSERDRERLANGQTSGTVERALAQYLNEEFELTNSTAISQDDVRAILNGESLAWAEKIGATQADKTFKWTPGTALEVLQNKKTFAKAVEEGFANSIAELIGLNSIEGFSFEGDLQQKYGLSLLQERLGLNGQGKNRAEDFALSQLFRAFGISSSTGSLNDLRNDSDFWTSSKTTQALAFADSRLGVRSGTSERFLKGQADLSELVKQAATDNINNLTVGGIWEYFDLNEQYLLRGTGRFIEIKGVGGITENFDFLGTIANWDSASKENQDQVVNLAKQIVGRSMDRKTAFALDFFYGYLQAPTQTEATQMLIDQGVRQLAIAFGANIDGFTEEGVRDLTTQILHVFDGRNDALEYEDLLNTVLDATDIPNEYRDDAQAFLRGDFRTGLSGWSAAIWSRFANEYLPEDGPLNYADIRASFVMDDEAAINARIDAIAERAGMGTLTAEQRAAIRGDARRELMQEAKDNAQYKLSDAMITKATGETLPTNFSKIMFTGSDQERTALLIDFGISKLEESFKRINPAYEEGTLLRVLNGDISDLAADRIILSIVNRTGASFAPFNQEFAQSFYAFVKADDKSSFFTNSDYNQMWNQFDSWTSQALGIEGMPAGLTRSLYLAYDNGWDFNARIVNAEGVVTVPSINDIGQSLVISKITEWGDKTFGMPAGTVYRVYQASQGVINASSALAHAKTTGDVARISNARAGLSGAQAELTLVIITLALNACSACQEFFSSIDQAISAPPGFTNALVAGAIAMSLGLGPAGLIIAAMIFAFGVYRVDYLCPIPPTDRYSIVNFDPPADQLVYKWGSYYQDPSRKVESNPAEGQNPFDWDDNVPFADGNDPHLWRAWARYYTGTLLNTTVEYASARENIDKPTQVITYRQANVEYFAPQAEAAFGAEEKDNPRLGMGFTQTTTKTTDWVHIAFGGLF